MEHSFDVVKATNVINVDVKSPSKENLGKIEDIILDKRGGQVRYAVLSFGGFLGLGDKLFALPWKSIHYSPEDKSFILNVDKEKLKNAPGFDKNNWPNMADPQWEKSILNYYDAV